MEPSGAAGASMADDLSMAPLLVYRPSRQAPYLMRGGSGGSGLGSGVDGAARRRKNSRSDARAGTAATLDTITTPSKGGDNPFGNSSITSSSTAPHLLSSSASVPAFTNEADAAAGSNFRNQQNQQPQRTPSSLSRLLQRAGGGGGGTATTADGSSRGLRGSGDSFSLLNSSAEEQASLIPSTPSARNFLLAAAGGPTTARQQQLQLQQSANNSNQATPDWRLKDRMKTVGIGLIMALNVGTDPPDLTKPHPCAVLECWMDPTTVSRSKAKDLIGDRLEQQYSKWQLARASSSSGGGAGGANSKGGLRVRKALDPTVEDVRNLCLQLRRQARTERVLLHYNGHGVPRPTSNGEIWVFDKNHTEYIPLSILDLRQWVGTPTIVVLDCSAAGILLPSFTTPLAAIQQATSANGGPASAAAPTLLSVIPSMLGSNNNNNATTNNNNMMIHDEELASQWVRDTIVLCPCSEDEWLPMVPDYPADIFTSCLTTPIPIALRWFVNHHATSMAPHLSASAVDAIPGKANDRKTPLGELNWIFTAVTDSIAWNSLPKPLFQRLFRQDLLVASMFRNFLLADRILRGLGCTPVSYPPLPPGMAYHPLWRAWDLACETLLFQLMQSSSLPMNVKPITNITNKDGNNSTDGNNDYSSAAGDAAKASTDGNATGGGGVEGTVNGGTASSAAPAQQQQVTAAASTNPNPAPISSPFFSEQLTAFEVWLDFACIHKMQLRAGTLDSPEQLPVVLQVLLSQVHRIRALRLLRRFLDLGSWAVNLSLSLGIFPYVMKLLQSPEYKSLLVSIWASILAFDPSCRTDLLKDGAFHHFVQHLMWGLNNAAVDVSEAAKERTLAAFVMAAACHEYPGGQTECVRLNLHGNCCALLSSYEVGETSSSPEQNMATELQLPPHFRLWICMCLGNMVKDNTPTQNEAYHAGVHVRLFERIKDRDADVRASVCYALGCLIGTPPRQGSRASSHSELAGLDNMHQQQRHHQNQQGMGGGGGPAVGTFTTTGFMAQRAPGGQRQSHPGAGAGGAPMTSAGIPNIQWRPQQHLEPMPGVNNGAGHLLNIPPSQPQGGQQMGMSQFLSQSSTLNQLRPAGAGTHGQGQHGMPGQSMQPGSHLTPGGFLVVGNSIHGQPPLIAPMLQQQQQLFQLQQLSQQQQSLNEPTRQQLSPSVFEDRRRLEFDLSVIETAQKATEDASVVVRYEATIALACAVAKYRAAFIVVAEEQATQASPAYAPRAAYPPPRGLDRIYVARFKSIWKTIRSLQHKDPFPPISKAANAVVSFVHEHLLRFRMETDGNEGGGDDEDEHFSSSSAQLLKVLSGIDENFAAGAGILPLTGASHSLGMGRAPKNLPASPKELRRALSESVSKESGVESMERRALLAASMIGEQDNNRMNYKLPKSEYYEWKKSSFDTNFQNPEEEDFADLDPLSPAGAAASYQRRRNFGAIEEGKRLGDRYASLAPAPPKPSKKSIEMLLEQEDEEALWAAEEEAMVKKSELQLHEKKLLKNNDVEMTTMLEFHPFEDVLMACGATESVSLWDTNSGEKLVSFDNGNPKGSRMTTCSWINEDSSSLFLVGCDDGSVRIWGDFLESNGEPSFGDTPSLLSAFFALPMEAGQRGSGLICEWQPASGTLLAGGNSRIVKCLDLDAEQQVCDIDTNTNANITTITTAWDFDSPNFETTHGYQGIGPDVVVAGLSDGSLKVFDLRFHCAAVQELVSEPRPNNRHRKRLNMYSEHKSWVVSTAFTSYSNRFEIVSGTVSGEIKAWDLRLSSSIRTLDVQRSNMTTMAIHPRIPLVATGSHAQFIKTLTLDGDTLQVLRYHEKMASHRIGPVSCLAFHRYKPILAGGSTDTFIGLYGLKSRIN